MKSTYRTNSLVARDQCLETGESFWLCNEVWRTFIK
jgi:hypothetical protein